MRYMIVENGVVTNCAESEYALEENWVLSDTASIGDLYSDGSFSSPPAPMPTLEDYDNALTEHQDNEARKRRYADRISCAVRAGFAGPFQAEGIAFAQWMDTTNQIGYKTLNDFQTGLIPQPTVAEFIATLPPMVWPNQG